MSRFNVLSVSGGGYMGLYSALVLAQMEHRSGHLLRDSFDLIAGTSIGGVIALAAAQGVPMSRVARSFLREGERVFPVEPPGARPWGVARRAWRLMSGPKHDAARLRAALNAFMGGGMTMGDIRHRVCVSAVDLTQGLPHTFRTAYSENNSNSSEIEVLDVAMAASAAPLLFPLHKIGDSIYCDGALYANSPDLLALHEAEVICRIPHEDIHMLSIGTTSAGFSFGNSELSLGLRDWLSDHRMMKLIMSTQQSHAHRLAAGRLGPRYLRIDEERDERDLRVIGLDRADRASRSALRNLAKRTASRVDTIEGCLGFMDHKAPKNVDWHHDNGVRPSLI
jgi:uncharacterized protein